MLSELVHSEIAYYNNLRNEPTPEAFCALCNRVLYVTAFKGLSKRAYNDQ